MNPGNKQEDKVALITGGARRIGAALVKALHKAGYRVVIHCHASLREAHLLATELNYKRMNSVLVLQRELKEKNMAQEMMKAIEQWAGALDLLVNNASVFLSSEREVFSEKDWSYLFDVNVRAPFLLSLAAYPLLKGRRGSIVNISDIHAERPLKGYSVYCQTKAALEMQTKSLAREFAPEVRVNAIAPGPITWPEHGNTLSPEIQEKIIQKTLLKSQGDPEHIAQAVMALADNSFITGQIIKVDGGRSLRD